MTPVAARALGVAVAARLPTLLWGAPGTGKSSAVRAMAESVGWPCEVVIASIREPSDFAGLPIVAGTGVRFAPPLWAERLAAGGDGVLFLDEISTAPPAVQAALLRVVLERVVGDLTLPPQVAVVAAANPPDQAADGWDLSPPLANRFCHLDWSPAASEVVEGLAGGFPVVPIPDLPSGWRDRVARTTAVVAGFLAVRPALVAAPPKERSAAGRAWPSPRTWEMAATLQAAAEVSAAPPEVLSALVRGAVGDGPGTEYLAWLEAFDLPDPEALLADPGSFVLPERGDRVYAVLTAVASAVAARPTVERWRAGWAVMAVAGERAPDVAAMAARILARCRPDGAVAPPEAAAFVPLLTDAGLLP
jgi:hypothetical protein